jgi:hypothetical protein
MPEHQPRTASDGLYDHEREEPRSGRRRRPVADWGVGEDMFEHMPRNRFSRAAEGPPRDRRFSPAAGVQDEPRRGTGPNRDDHDHLAEPPRRPSGKPPEVVPRGPVDDGRRTIVIGKPEDVPSEIAAITADRDLGDEPAPGPELPGGPGERRTRPAQGPELPGRPGERRTVRIGGRPEGSLDAARFHRDHARRRPPRRAHERLGARPDRIAMWAFALGLLLIVIAILSAH